MSETGKVDVYARDIVYFFAAELAARWHYPTLATSMMAESVLGMESAKHFRVVEVEVKKAHRYHAEQLDAELDALCHCGEAFRYEETHLTMQGAAAAIAHVEQFRQEHPEATHELVRIVRNSLVCRGLLDRTFHWLTNQHWYKGQFVCVGLDTDYEKIPNHMKVGRTLSQAVANFNGMIVQATADIAAAYKLNFAFYEAEGEAGMRALLESCGSIRTYAPGAIIILDAKRADIGSTNEGTAKMAFDLLKADAITVNPYLGQEALEPFLKRKDKGIIALCRTSNPGAGEFQDLLVDGKPLYQHVAGRVANSWPKHCGLVVGATYPEELAAVRAIAPNTPLLIPGIGAQGGDLDATVRAGKDANGWGFLINSSRGIIYASSGKDFAQAARAEAERLHQSIAAILARP